MRSNRTRVTHILHSQECQSLSSSSLPRLTFQWGVNTLRNVTVAKADFKLQRLKPSDFFHFHSGHPHIRKIKITLKFHITFKVIIVMPAFSLNSLMFHTKFKTFLPDSPKKQSRWHSLPLYSSVFLIIQMSLDNINLHSQQLSKSL